jgi:hypothetical protein
MEQRGRQAKNIDESVQIVRRWCESKGFGWSVLASLAKEAPALSLKSVPETDQEHMVVSRRFHVEYVARTSHADKR